MKKTFPLIALQVFLISLFHGCSNGPSPEQVTREQREAQDTARRQDQFFKASPPPLEQPGQ